MKYTTERVEAIAAKLRALPTVEKKRQEHSKQEVVKMIAKEIADLQKRGYSFDMIVEALRAEELVITTATLKSYLQRIKSGRTRKKTTANPMQANPMQNIPVVKEAKRETVANKADFIPKPDSDDI